MNSTFYTSCTVLTTGCHLYQDNAGVTPVIDGYYSDYTDCFTVVSGIITNISSCTPVTSYQYLASVSATNGFSTQGGACTGTTVFPIWSSASTINAITTGSVLYGDTNLTSVWTGQAEWYGLGTTYGATPLSGYQITNSGVVTSIGICIPPVTSYSFAFSSPGRSSASLACAQVSFPLTLWASSNSISMGMQMYTSSDLSTPFGSGNLWYQYGIDGISYRIDNSGQIAEAVNCALPTTQYSFIRDGSQNCAGFHIPYIVYKDAYNITQTLYLDECADICAQFDASSIISQHYVTPCPGIAVSIQIGDQFCLGGNCQLNGNLSTVTVYSSTGTALPGDFLYTTAALTTPYTTLKFIKKGTNIMDVNSGTGELYLDCSTSGSGAC